MTKLADVAFDDTRDAAADARLSIRSRALASLLTPAALDVNPAAVNEVALDLARAHLKATRSRSIDRSIDRSMP